MAKPFGKKSERKSPAEFIGKAIGGLEYGTHICQFCETEKDLLEIFLPYFKAGIANGEFCVWVVSRFFPAEKAAAAIKKTFGRKNKIGVEIITAGEADVFEPRRALRQLEKQYCRSIAGGYRGMRIGISLPASFPGKIRADQAIYEKNLNNLVGSGRMVALCAYPARRTGAGNIIDAAGNHGLTLAKQSGDWSVIENRVFEKIQNALRENERRYRSLFDGMTESFALCELVLDKDGKPSDYRYIEINPSFEHFIGLKRDRIIGKLRSQIPIRLSPASFAQYIKTALTGKPARFENYNETLGKYYYVYTYRPAPFQFATIYTDITELKKIERKLRESKEKAKNLIKYAPAAIYEIDFDKQRYTSVNDVMCQYLGYTREEMLSINPFDIIDCDNQEDLKEKIIKSAALGKMGSSVEYKVKAKNGREFIALLNITPIYKGKRIGGAFVVAHDITDRRNTENAVRQANESLEMAQNAAGSGIWDWDLQKNEMDWSRQLFNLFGFDSASTKPDYETWSAILHPDDRKTATNQVARSIAKATPLNSEYRIIRPDNGQVRWINSLGNTVYGISGNPLRMSGICLDITERKRAEEEGLAAQIKLKQHAKKLEKAISDLKNLKLAVENASDLIFIADPQGTILSVNRAIKKLLGYKPREIVGKKASFLGGPRGETSYGKILESVKIEKKSFMGEVINVHKNGREMTFESNISPVIDRKGDAIFFIGIERDRTQALEIDRAKTEFISLAAHQLRTPLATISLASEMLLNINACQGDLEAKEQLNEICATAHKMAGMIELFLDLSRIELGRLEIDPEPLDIAGFALEIAKEITPQAISKKISLKTTAGRNIPIVNIDRKIMHIAIENLLSNAIKYTPENGTVKLSIRLKKDKVVIAVADNGRGIPKNQLPLIFTKMFRAGNVGDVQGIGLGLNMTKSLVEESGGSIKVVSKENIGSVFSVSIPLSGMKKKKIRIDS